MKIKYLNIIIILSFVFTSHLSYGVLENQHVIEELNLTSEALGSEQSIKIYLPKGYSESKTKFPTLYILDGQRFGMMAAGYQQELSFNNQTPKFIVIAITGLQARERREQYNNNFDGLKKFLIDELIPMIDTKYKSNKQRLLFGWELAGSFVWHLYQNKRADFKGFISSSANYGNKEQSPLLNISRARNDSSQLTSGYFGIAENEIWMIDEVNDIALLQAKQDSKIQINVDIQKSSDHWSNSFYSLYKGIRHYYRYYQPLKFANLLEFKEFGGVAELNKYYQRASKRYEVAPTVPHSTIHLLMYLSMKEKNYQHFLTIVKEYSLDGSKAKLPLWPLRMAKFHLTNGNTYLAEKTVTNALTNFPKSKKLKELLKGIYNEKGD